MAEASSVRGRLCNTTFDLEAAQIRTLGEFVRQYREAGGPAPRPASSPLNHPWWARPDAGADAAE
jgi:hypothetical protein